MRPKRIGVVFSVCALVHLGHGRQQDLPSFVGHGIQTRHWTTQEGLPQNSVNAIAQTPEGYLWMGTFGGLVRFDGRSMRPALDRDGARLAGLRILSLCVDRAGVLWIGTEGQGLFRYEDGVATPVEHPDGGTWGNVWTVVVDSDGAVLAGGRGLVRCGGGTDEVRLLRPIDGAPLSNVRDLHLDDDGALWTVTNGGVAVRHPGDESFELVDARAGWTIGEDEDGRILLNAQSRFYELVDDRFVAIADVGPSWTLASLRDDRGRMWFGGDAGLQRARASAAGRLELVDVMTSADLGGDVREVFEDREGNLWVGVDGGGVWRVNESRSAELTDLRPDGGSSVFQVAGQDVDDLWLVFADRELRRLVDGVVREPPFRLDGLQVKSIGMDEGGTLWIGTEGPLLTWRDELRTEPAWPNVSAQLHAGRDGWLASLGSLRHVVAGREAEHLVLPKSWGEPTTLVHARAGGVWIVTPKVVARAHRGRVTALPDDEQAPFATYRSVYEDRAGTLWIATYGAGLIRRKGEDVSVIGTDRGLLDVALGRVLGNEDFLWFNSNKGVFCVRRETLEAVADGDAPWVDSILLNESEGNGGGGLTTRDGWMWFPSIRGLVGVPPDVRMNTAKPNVVIEEVSIDGVPVASEPGAVLREVTIEPGADRLELHFLALSLTDPARCSYRYRLAGRDRGWVYGTQRSSAVYSGLDPGDYRFEVRASNNDGFWSDTGASLQIAVEPHFYETLWFKGVAALVVLLAALGTHRWWTARRRLELEIGQRSRAEELLRASEDSLRVVAETANDGIITIDEESRILYANPAVERLFGVSLEEVEGTPVTDLMPAADRERNWNRIREYMRTGQRSMAWDGLAVTARRRDGTEFPIEISLGDHRRPDGRRAVTAIVRDITERRRLQEQLAESQKMEALGRLAGGIAHDFNNILTVLLGNVDLAHDASSPDQGRNRFLEEIRKCGERAAALTRQLLAFSRRQMIRPRLLQPDRKLEELQSLLERLIPENIDVRFVLAAEQALVRADPTQFEQLVINLAVNARDAMPRGGSIEIATKVVDVGDVGAGATEVPVPAATCLCLTVTDSGVGIHDAVLPHIFEPFFTTKPVGAGTGLGLASVHGIVQQAGGTIDVESRAGSGTCFRVLLPIAVDEGQAVQPTPSEAGTFEGTTSRVREGRILICDDYDGILQMMHATLRAEGHEIVVADRPRAALDRASSFSPDLLITDLVMPEMSGHELAQRIRRKHPNVRVLFISGYTEELEPTKGGEGKEEILGKPFTSAKLLERVRELLGASAVWS